MWHHDCNMLSRQEALSFLLLCVAVNTTTIMSHVTVMWQAPLDHGTNGDRECGSQHHDI
jgi:hypothetical protein